MQKIISSEVTGYKPAALLNPCFFIRIVQGLASFRRPILQNSSELLLLHFSNQIFKFKLFRQRLCVFIWVNISYIIKPLLCNVVCCKQTIQ